MVLHIDDGAEWRGGQQQAFYLHRGLAQRGIQTLMACPEGSPMQQRCREADLPVTVLNSRGELDLFAGRKAARIAREQGHTLIHCHTAHALSTGVWAGTFSRGLKIIGVRRVDFHLKGNLFSRRKYKGADRIVCISDAIRNVLRQDGIGEDRLVTIHSGVDTGRFSRDTPPDGYRKSLGVPDDHLLAGTVAALAGHKDYPNLLAAAGRVIKEYDKITFCAFGDGPLKGELKALHAELGLGDRFVFAGYRHDVGAFLNSLDLFVLASSKEGLGTSLLDAQAAGVPVAATSAGGIPEAVTDTVNGLLVPPRDPDALAGIILRLAGDPDLRRRLGKRGRESVQEFSIERTIDKNIDLYHQIT